MSVLCFLRACHPSNPGKLSIVLNVWQHLLWWFLLIPPGRQPRRPDQNASWQWKAIISEEKFHLNFTKSSSCVFNASFSNDQKTVVQMAMVEVATPPSVTVSEARWHLAKCIRSDEICRSAQADRIAWMRRFLVALELWSKPWFLGFGRHN